ncbi:MAG: fructose-bisphosphate aldolase class I [Hyphomicrobiaceae bacterium]|nr:fructose-bisphosphate aldolase class I [Hyphomicrobiaceae bacterium]
MLKCLEEIAQKLVTPGQGILAADESDNTIKKNFDSIAIKSTQQSRRDYREMLFREKKAIQEYISGIILFDETIRQKAADGTPLIELISSADAIPGIKVDRGTKLLTSSDIEKITEGLDGLRERLVEYYEMGARFAKWRAVITITDLKPTRYCINVNAHALARYAYLCQEVGLVPIVEPEVLMDSEHAFHDINRCYEVTASTLRVTFEHLIDAGVSLDSIVLKANMVTSGRLCVKQACSEEVAELTVRCLKTNVPSIVPGIAFLSGGQNEVLATERLSLMNQISNLPWNLTFSYGRALQATALATWAGSKVNVLAAQKAFSYRAKMNSLATFGKWNADIEVGLSSFAQKLNP